MRILSTLGLAAAALGVCLPGCVAEHAIALDEVQEDLVTVPPPPAADPDDPFGTCDVTTALENGDNGACSLGGRCAGTVMGDAGSHQFWSYCLHLCEWDSDCPQPLTGNVQPVCASKPVKDEEGNGGYGICDLPCDDENSICPEGFVCHEKWFGGVLPGSIDPNDPIYVCKQYATLANSY